jgi:Insertion element 4 transposase N-terminal/Transposase DDE domain
MVSGGQIDVESRPSGRLTDHIGLGVLAARFHRDLLEEVINATGCREKRKRLLPAHVMIRYVIAMGLYFDESYEEVMRLLVGSLRAMGSWVDDWQVPTSAAISQARARLGVAPLAQLFERAARPVATSGTKGAWLARRRLMAIDGTTLDVADTPDNVARFGRLGSGPKASAYPKLALTALAECATHAIVAAEFGGCRTGERTQAAALARYAEPDMLILADAGFYSWQLWDAYAATGADLAWRVGASVSVASVRWLPDGSYLALIFKPGLRTAQRQALQAQARAGGDVDADLARLVRVVEYEVPNRNPDGELIVVITTVLNPYELPAIDLAGAYQQRWEEESALDELKTHLRDAGGVLRSKTPDLVEQEMWGLLLAHYGIRALICDAADEAGYDPDRLSFLRTVRVVRRQVTDQAALSP